MDERYIGFYNVVFGVFFYGIKDNLVLYVIVLYYYCVFECVGYIWLDGLVIIIVKLKEY